MQEPFSEVVFIILCAYFYATFPFFFEVFDYFTSRLRVTTCEVFFL